MGWITYPFPNFNGATENDELHQATDTNLQFFIFGDRRDVIHIQNEHIWSRIKFTRILSLFVLFVAYLDEVVLHVLYLVTT